MSTDGEPSADISGPTVPRMILGNQLHRFREAAGISPKEKATRKTAP